MQFVDVHAHLDFPEFKDLDTLIPQWKSAGVKAVISNGVHAESNRKILELAKTHDIIKPALGFYPVHAVEVSEEDFDKELEFIQKQQPIALGEVGLDYSSGDDNPFGDDKKKEMKACFEKIIRLAEKKRIPLMVHSRKAEFDVVDMLESSSTKKIVMHCFMGKKSLAKRIVDNGWYTSIPCIIVRSQQFQDMIGMQHLSKLLTETDAPYLSPFKDGKPNQPSNIIETIKKIAELKGMDQEEVANNLFKNYQDLFL